jgi:thiol-disulfide isomerase/thioredoxin
MIDLGDVTSDVKIITFWASWNPYSADELRTFNRIEDEYGDAVAVVALNRDTYPTDGKLFLQKESIRDNLIFVYDRDDAYYHMVDGFAVPETLFLNREGDIVFHKHGPITETEIKQHIEQIL